MSFDVHFVDSGDPEKRLRIGCGMLLDPSLRGTVLSEARYDAELEASEREQRDLDEVTETGQREAAETAAFWAARHGEVPTYSVSDFLKRYDAATEREDRRARSREHRSDCGCQDCGATSIGAGGQPRPPHRLPSIVDKELRQSEQAFMNAPADIGLVQSLIASALKKFRRS